MTELTARKPTVINELHAQFTDVENNVLTVCIDTVTLMDLSKKRFWLRMFFIATANYWPHESNCIAILSKIHILFTRFALLVSAGTVGWSLIFSIQESFNDKAFNLSTPVFGALLVATISVMLAQYCNRNRIHAPLSKEEVAVTDTCLQSTFLFAVFALLTVTCGIIMSGVSVDSSLSYTLIHFYVALVLSSTMFYFMLDLHSSSAILDHLLYLADKQLLTMEVFREGRASIRNKVRASRLASDFIIVPCIASAIGIVFIVLDLERQMTTHSDDDYHAQVPVLFSSYILVLLKELIYLFVAFWYVARVNEAADQLTLKLSEGWWYGCSQAINTNTSTDKDEDKDIPLLRTAQHSTQIAVLFMHASSVSDPISYNLLFKRVSKQNVAVSLLGFGVTILAGVIKNSV
jgi:hypothetical protein